MSEQEQDDEGFVMGEIKQFEVGKTYYTRSMTDYDHIYSFDIVSRTAKSVVILMRGKAQRRT